MKSSTYVLHRCGLCFFCILSHALQRKDNYHLIIYSLLTLARISHSFDVFFVGFGLQSRDLVLCFEESGFRWFRQLMDELDIREETLFAV